MPNSEVSAEIPDWGREKPRRFWDPSRKLLLSIRRYQYWQRRGGVVAQFAKPLIVLRHWFWGLVAGAEIPLDCDIGGGLLIPHPSGIVIDPGVKIGVNCLISQQVMIGTWSDVSDVGVPVLQGDVNVGAGAKILGSVCIGGHATIRENAVVSCDVVPYSVAAGIPAKVIEAVPENPTSLNERIRLERIRLGSNPGWRS